MGTDQRGEDVLMRPFLEAFADELIKVAAFPQQSGGEQSYNDTSAKVMDQSQGTNAKVGLKAGSPVESAPVVHRPSPTPLTTPNQMVDYASRAGR